MCLLKSFGGQIFTHNISECLDLLYTAKRIFYININCISCNRSRNFFHNPVNRNPYTSKLAAVDSHFHLAMQNLYGPTYYYGKYCIVSSSTISAIVQYLKISIFHIFGQNELQVAVYQNLLGEEKFGLKEKICIHIYGILLLWW